MLHDANIFKEKYLKNYLCIVEVTMTGNNCIYPLCPSKDSKGCLIYPSNTFRGVYNSIDILEAINDGYEILKVHRGIYWVQKVKLFENLINYLYNNLFIHFFIRVCFP